MTAADDIKDFYNAVFFPDGHAGEAELDITIRSGGAEIRIHNIRVSPLATLETIIRSYHHFLKTNGPISAPLNDRSVGIVEAEKDKLVNFEVMHYRGRKYFLEERPGEVFQVRKENGEVISEQSPTARGVVKLYRESREAAKE